MRFRAYPPTHDVVVTLVSTSGERLRPVRTRRLISGELHPPVRFRHTGPNPFYADHVEINVSSRLRRHRYQETIHPGDEVVIR